MWCCFSGSFASCLSVLILLAFWFYFNDFFFFFQMFQKIQQGDLRVEMESNEDLDVFLAQQVTILKNKKIREKN
jgi:hypothetical protein